MTDGRTDAAPRVADVLAVARERLGGDGPVEARWLLGHVLGRSQAWLVAHAGDAVDATDRARFDALIARRAAGEPVAQLTGRCGFWTLDLAINGDVLVPRADTELLVERALEVLPADQAIEVADLGTGSGAIALAIAAERPLARIVAVDASSAALAVASANAAALGLEARVACVQGDWCEPLEGRRFDALLSNPPYIADGDPHLAESDLRFEPPMALASGPDGLDAIRVISRGAPAHLLPGGWLVLEHGWEQGAVVRDLLRAHGFEAVATHRDIEGRERITMGRVR